MNDGGRMPRRPHGVHIQGNGTARVALATTEERLGLCLKHDSQAHAHGASVRG